MQTEVHNVKISAIATCVPQKQVDVFDNKNIYGGNLKKLTRIVKETGFHKRHILSENSKVTAGDLCLKAAEEIIKVTGTNKDDFSAIIMLTQYPDYFEPATACVLHGKLGLKNDCIAFDINQGCAGYLYGLLVASKLVNEKNKKVLLLCGDTATRVLGTQENIAEDIPIFGDGGCATILEYSENAYPMYFDIGNMGTKYDVIGFNNGCFRNPPTKEMFNAEGKFNYGNHMDGLAIFEFTMNVVPTSINTIMNLTDIKDEQIDYYILHQANKMILENIASCAGINVDKVLRKTLSEYGNLSSASLASVINDEYEKFNHKKVKLLLNAFGIGLSWGSVILELDGAECLPMILYKE